MEREEVKRIIAKEVVPLIQENRNLREGLAQVGINPPTEQERVAVDEGLAEAFGFPRIPKGEASREDRARRKCARLVFTEGRRFANFAESRRF